MNPTSLDRESLDRVSSNSTNILLESTKNTLDLFNSLRNIVTEPILNHVTKNGKYSMVLNPINI